MSKIIMPQPTFRGPRYYVPNMKYSADVSEDGFVRAEWSIPPVAANATGFLSAQSIAAAGSSTSFAAAYLALTQGLAQFGRNVAVVASGAATSTVQIDGFDWLGQKMTETLTLNGATPVLGAKAFYEVTKVTWALTAGTTINVGWGDRLGLPYRAINAAIQLELVSQAVPTAGAMVAGALIATAQTATTADPTGYYTPQAAFVADGVRTYVVGYFADVENLHGAAHFAA